MTKYLTKMKNKFAVENAFDKFAKRNYDNNLRLKTTEDQAQRVTKVIQDWAKRQDYKYKRSIQSAMFSMTFVLDNKQVMEVDGWHGTGKGNRNYGDSYAILSVYGDHYKKHFRVLDSTIIDYIGSTSYFTSEAAKTEYLDNLARLETAIKAGNIETLFT